MKKASAKAHPIQGLIKYHGLKDDILRIPYHDSISVCTAPFETHTTIAFSNTYSENQAFINGEKAEGRVLERICCLVKAIQEKTEQSQPFYMVSQNNFPSNIGLGASSSGFAALALATCKALELEWDYQTISTYARLGAGSACRSLTGGFSYWVAGDSHESSYSYQLESPLDFAILFAVVPAFKETENAHREALTSPLFSCRLSYIPQVLTKMKTALQEGDFHTMGELAEKDTLNLHAITMTGKNGVLHWRPETIAIMLEVQKMRKDGIPAYFSIDTGATVYVNTLQEYLEEVEKRIQSLGIQTHQGFIGGPAQVVEDHLF
ncbi:MAG: diphosphomevalonate decarboxylase [Planctomycetota bacterium]|nr:MAG: diphosphomevalonate decarboxylase [Planctomycetota bacterium]